MLQLSRRGRGLPGTGDVCALVLVCVGLICMPVHGLIVCVCRLPRVRACVIFMRVR